MMDWSLTLQIAVLSLGLWLFTAYMTRSFPTLTGKRICLLIAHPDDEAMFFAPVLQWLTRPELGNRVFLLCLSTGDADGLGHIRREELLKSALMLGITSAEHLVVLDDAKLPDSMEAQWDPKLIASILTRYFAPALASTPSTAPPATLLDALITFDAGGVSGHPNHIALYDGAMQFLRGLMQRHVGWECPIKLYTLTSVSVWRKYTSFVDAAATIAACVWRRKERGQFPTPLLVVNMPTAVRKGQRAMTQAHRSQMRWFRWGWIGLSRYMVVNDLKKEKV